jgi:hypothetical protein
VARDRLLKKLIRERFHVTLTSGESFDGLLDEWDAKHLVFVDAGTRMPLDHAQTQRVPVSGKLFLPRDRISYMQAVT